QPVGAGFGEGGRFRVGGGRRDPPSDAGSAACRTRRRRPRRKCRDRVAVVGPSEPAGWSLPRPVVRLHRPGRSRRRPGPGRAMTTAVSDLQERLDSYADEARRFALAALEDSGSRYLLEPTSDYLRRPGKGIRPALCLATCAALGADPARALPTAAALELFHTAFLVHDDVEDESHLRRGESTLHRRYGRAVAINAGDALALFALRMLGQNRRLLGERIAARIWQEFDYMAGQTVEGQAIEPGWRRDGEIDITPDDYLDLIMKKTCWYTTVLPLRVGALIAGRRAGLEPLVRFGFFLGAAFQIRDDILNLIGGDAYGKERSGDLREGKRTLMLIHLLRVATDEERRRLASYLSGPRRSPAAIEEVRAMLDRYGSIAFADRFAQGIARSAAVAFEEAFGGVPDSSDLRFIEAMVPFMVERDR